MIKIKHIFPLLFIFLFVACGDKKKHSDSLIYVSAVLDGDTFEANGQRYRIAEIDAPEKNQTFGTESKLYLQSLIKNKPIKIIPVTKDKYGRQIVKVFVGENYVAEDMVKNGFAWHYSRYSNNQKLKSLQKSAQKNKKGLWKYPAVNPYKFRQFNKY